MELNLAVQSLFESQLNHWDLAGENYAALQNIQVRTLIVNDIKIQIQFNPHRITSSSARVDSQSINARPCFLCENNRPPVQQGIRYRDGLILLVNPYPVFRGHLTIPTLQHVPQQITSHFGKMIELARDLPHYTVIYNGPQCGASAPDHFHFQAVPGGNLPIESDFAEGNNCRFEAERHGTRIYSWTGYLRNLITLQGNDAAGLESLFHAFYDWLGKSIPADGEPMMNILAGSRGDEFVIHLFPRKLHRPDRYFAAGDARLLLSPASIDLGGVLIMPREEDYRKITPADIRDVFQQVCISDSLIQYLVKKLIQIT